jgi:hypothetical protein
MEMLSGEDLADVLGRERALTPGRAVRIMYQVARALHATHKKSIVHRDLKPENVYLIERDGAADIVKVVDFGVAKMNDVETPAGRRLTRTGMIFGTPEYMSPEQALGKPFDHRVDIYAHGAIFYELLTGRVPFDGENFMEILAKHAHSQVPSLRESNPHTRVSPELERVVMRALCKDPAERYQSMGDLAAELRSVPEMPSVEPGDALEPAPWELQVTPISSRPPPLPRNAGRSANDRAEAEVVSIVMQNEGGLVAALKPLAGAPMPLLAAAGAAPAGAFGSSIDADDALANTGRWQRRQTRASSGRGSRRDARGQDDARSDLRSGPELVVPRLSMMRAQRLILLAAAAAALGLFAGHVVRSASAPTLTTDHETHKQVTSVANAEAPAAASRREMRTTEDPLAVASADAHSMVASTEIVLQPNGLATPTVLSQLDRVAQPELPPPQSTIAPAGPDTKSPNLVEVQVRTDPAGARVRAVGMNAHCSAAPCALSVPRGRPVTLRAGTGRNAVERTLTFEDKSEVELRLSAVTRPPTKSQSHSDLKIPAIFRE